MAVLWIAGSAHVHATSTSIAATTPAGIQDGDHLIAFVFHRSALTPPSGWTAIEETGLFSNGSFNQYLTAVKKDSVVSGNSSASFTWTQSASGRIGVIYAVVRGGQVIGSGANIVEQSTSTIAIPSFTAVNDDEMYVSAASTIIQAPSGTITPTAPSGFTLFSGGAEFLRIAGAYGVFDAGQSVGGSFDLWPSSAPSSNGLGAITLRIDNAKGRIALAPFFGDMSAAARQTAAQIRANALFGDIALQAETEIVQGSILVDPLFGDLEIRAKPFIIEASVTGSPLFGDLSAYALQTAAQMRAAHLFGELGSTARVYPPPAAEIPSGVTRYFCKLTGTPDLILPLSSFSVRHRVGSASYYNVVIPSYDFVSGIAARPLGQIVIWSDTDGVEEELSRGTLGDVRTDRGPRSQSITISGNSSQAATTKKTYILDDALYAYSTFDGEQRLRIRPRAAIRPGDTVRYGATFFEVGLVSWSVSANEASMEIATVAPSGEVDPPTEQEWPCDGALPPLWTVEGDVTYSGGALVLTAPGETWAVIQTPEPFVSAGTVTVDIDLALSGASALLMIGSDGATVITESQDYTEMTFEIVAGETFLVALTGGEGGTAVARIRSGSGSEYFECQE